MNVTAHSPTVLLHSHNRHTNAAAAAMPPATASSTSAASADPSSPTSAAPPQVVSGSSPPQQNPAQHPPPLGRVSISAFGGFLSDFYRVFHLLRDLGWVDLDWGVSQLHPSRFCQNSISPSRIGRHTVEHPKSMSTQPNPGIRSDETPCCFVNSGRKRRWLCNNFL